MPDETSTQLPSFPMTRRCPFQPPSEYESLRTSRPVSKVVLPTGREAWLITSYEFIRRVLTDPRVTSDRAHPGYPLLVHVPPEALRMMSQTLIGVDPPRHTQQRRLVLAEFTVKRVQRLRPRIQELVDSCVTAMLDEPERPVDLVKALSLPVPSLVICELLGVPYRDHELFQQLTMKLVNHRMDPAERAQAGGELVSYLDRLVTEKEQSGNDDDLLGRLVRRNREEGVLDHADMLGMARILLLAGFETTANMISLGVAALLSHPEQLAELRGDPALMRNAVEELLRYFSILDVATARAALADIELGDVTIRAGDGLLSVGAAANWDETVFADPDVIDIHRDARGHVAFGFGPHQCLGQHLARLELEIVFNTLFARLPGLRLAAPVEDLPFKDDASVYGLYALPVTW
jgi:cytochrome P450